MPGGRGSDSHFMILEDLNPASLMPSLQVACGQPAAATAAGGTAATVQIAVTSAAYGPKRQEHR